MRQKTADLFIEVQKEICATLERLDGRAKFETDLWERTDESGAKGGGGRTCILRQGAVFEQAGVNFSAVYGRLSEEMSEKVIGRKGKVDFYATGISIVIHPFSPMIPTTHANFRYLEAADKSWFGGGMDLTPYYFFKEDAVHFHSTIKKICDRHDPSYYPEFKKWCDRYFYLPHRGETRGVGGIFYDYLGKDKPEEIDRLFDLCADLSRTYMECYVPIVERRIAEPWGEAEKNFQLIRRGRYVEFNLLYDRGTQFGLKTGGRTESILMSLPPNVRWQYNFEPAPGSREAALLEVVRQPRDWCDTP